MSLTVITPPADDPVSLGEVKDHLNLLSEDHDTYLSGLIKAASKQCETLVRQTALTTTYEKSFPCWASSHERSGLLELDKPPLQSVESISYVDTDGAQQTLAASEYVVKTDCMPGRVLRAYNVTWPSLRTQGVARPVVVRYVAGYSTPDDVPDEFKHAMKLMIGHWWMVRESVTQVSFTEVPQSAKALLSSVWHGEYP